MEYFIKALDDWKLEVLGVPYGSTGDLDSDGQYFDATTQTHELKMPTIPAVYYHGRNEDGKEAMTPAYIGTAKHLRTDSRGVWYEVVLDKMNEYAKRVWEAAKQGIARASSGSASHLVRLGENGHIKEWPVFELSVFDTGGNRQPSNRHAVAIPMMKAIYKEAGLPFPEIKSSEAVPEALKAVQRKRMKEARNRSKQILSKIMEK
jgi:hypothetical protein